MLRGMPLGQRAPEGSVLQSSRFGELAHRPLLLFRELLGNLHLRLDDEIPLLTVPLDPMPPDPEALPIGGTGGDAKRHLLSVERAHVDLRAQSGLRDADRHGGNDVQSLAFEEAIGPHPEGDDQVTRRPIVLPAPTLPLQSDTRSRVYAGRNSDEHLLSRADLSRSVARRTTLARYLAASEAHRAGSLHRESPLPEGDGPTTVALRTGLQLCAGRGTAAVTGRAFLVGLDLDWHFAAEGGDAERDVELHVDVLSTLRATVSSSRSGAPAAPAKHRTEDVTQTTKAADVEVLQPERPATR